MAVNGQIQRGGKNLYFIYTLLKKIHYLTALCQCWRRQQKVGTTRETFAQLLSPTVFLGEDRGLPSPNLVFLVKDCSLSRPNGDMSQHALTTISKDFLYSSQVNLRFQMSKMPVSIYIYIYIYNQNFCSFHNFSRQYNI